MSFQEVSSLDADVTVALGKTNKETGKPYPKQAEGYYLGSRKVENKRGESFIHFLQTSKGNLGVWGTTDLNRKLGQVAPGVMVRITSTGTKPTPNGDMYTYKVESDKSNIIEVGVSDNPRDDEDSDESYVANTTVYEADSSEDDDQVAELAALERKAKLEALLKRPNTLKKN